MVLGYFDEHDTPARETVKEGIQDAAKCKDRSNDKGRKWPSLRLAILVLLVKTHLTNDAEGQTNMQ
jgi:hypothetical protein